MGVGPAQPPVAIRYLSPTGPLAAEHDLVLVLSLALEHSILDFLTILLQCGDGVDELLCGHGVSPLSTSIV